MRNIDVNVGDVVVGRYGGEHVALEAQSEAVYGLTEVNRNMIANARLVANPGCYPTSVLLPLIPLLRAELIEATSIVIDSKSGKHANCFCTLMIQAALDFRSEWSGKICK